MVPTRSYKLEAEGQLVLICSRKTMVWHFIDFKAKHHFMGCKIKHLGCSSEQDFRMVWCLG